MVFVVLEKVLLHKVDQQFTNIRVHILAIWWVEPYDLSVSVSLSVLNVAIIRRNRRKCPLSFRGCLIDRFNFAELFLITR